MGSQEFEYLIGRNTRYSIRIDFPISILTQNEESLYIFPISRLEVEWESKVKFSKIELF